MWRTAVHQQWIARVGSTKEGTSTKHFKSAGVSLKETFSIILIKREIVNQLVSSYWKDVALKLQKMNLNYLHSRLFLEEPEAELIFLERSPSRTWRIGSSPCRAPVMITLRWWSLNCRDNWMKSANVRRESLFIISLDPESILLIRKRMIWLTWSLALLPIHHKCFNSRPRSLPEETLLKSMKIMASSWERILTNRGAGIKQILFNIKPFNIIITVILLHDNSVFLK